MGICRIQLVFKTGGHLQNLFLRGFLNGKFTGDASIAHDDDAVRYAQHFWKLGGYEDDADSLLFQLIHQLIDFNLGRNVDTARGFVKDHHTRRARQPFAHDHLLLVATGEAPRIHIGIGHLDAEIGLGPVSYTHLIAAIPCFLVLCCAGRIAGEIGRNNSFSSINARMLKYVAVLAAGDVGFLILGNGILAILGMNLPLLVLISAFVCFVGLAISIAAACLSHLVLKAAKLQEDSDLTI